MSATTEKKQPLACHECGKKYNVAKFRPGKRFRCKVCRAILTVPHPASDDAKGRYDARKKLLFCAGCARPIDVRNHEAGDTLDCPRCGDAQAVPPEHEPVVARPAKDVPAVYDAEARTLTCEGCGSEYNVARYKPGREILCAGCESVLVVPSDHQPARADDPKRRRYKKDARTRMIRLSRSGESKTIGHESSVAVESPPEAESVEAPSDAPEDDAERAARRKRRREQRARREARAQRRSTRSRARAEPEREPADDAEAEDEARPEREPAADADAEAATEAAPRSRRRRPRAPLKVPRLRWTSKGKLRMTCPDCGQKSNVTGFAEGKKVRCSGCETKLRIPAHPPKPGEDDAAPRSRRSRSRSRSTRSEPHAAPSGAGLDVIDLSGDAAPEPENQTEQESAPDIAQTRSAFSQFYEKEGAKALARMEAEAEEGEEEAAGGRRRTRATRMINTGEIDAILDPKIKGRKSLAEAIGKSAATTPKRARAAPQGIPRPLKITIWSTVVLGVVVVAYLLIKSHHDMKAHRAEIARRAAEALRKPEVAPDQAAGALRPGVRVEIKGIVRGGQGSVLHGGRNGFLLVTRGSGNFWVEDLEGAHKDTFKSILDRHSRRQRVYVRVVGTLRPIGTLSQREALPKQVVNHTLWLEAEGGSIEYLKHSDYMKLIKSISPVKPE